MMAIGMLKAPKGLTPAGKRFWNFLFADQEASGNDDNSGRRDTLLAFYRNDLEQNTFHQLHMEQDHGFIQWLFPLPSVGVNPLAPVLSKQDYRILSQTAGVKEKLLEHYSLFVSFLGLEETSNGLVKKHADRWNGWIQSPHNYLRISRALESLSNFELNEVAQNFFAFLNTESKRFDADGLFSAFNARTIDSCHRFWANCQHGSRWEMQR